MSLEIKAIQEKSAGVIACADEKRDIDTSGDIMPAMKRMQSVDDVIERIRANWRGYVSAYGIFLILVVLAAAADALSTVFFMLVRGPQEETHPVIRWIALALGPVLGPLVGKLVQIVALIAVTVYLRRWAVYLFVLATILYAWAAWYNILAIPILLHRP
jgi:hypothetical protein